MTIMADDKTSIEQTATALRNARQTKGLTQAEVAKKAGISENHYAQIERAEKNPTVSTFKSIIKAIGVSSTEILG
jgi:transcriptional regulator with XRE-family HTH domain